MKNKFTKQLIALTYVAIFSFSLSYSASNKDPMLEQMIYDCKLKGDVDCVNIFQRAQDIHMCQATKSFKTKDGSVVEAMNEEEVKEWIYYKHLYPKNCRYY